MAELSNPSAGFIDIGANLLDSMYQGVYNDKQKHAPDLDAVLARAREAGVQKMIVTAGTLHESRQALELASQHDCLYSTVGVHPTRCSELMEGDVDGYMAQLKEVLDQGVRQGKVVAVGECGLDYDRLHFCPKEQQISGFEMQFELAEHSGLPLFLHWRNCPADFVEVMNRNKSRWAGGGVVHSFDGSLEDVLALLDMGLHIGLNGCSLKTQQNLDVVRDIPVERLLLETDSPWCEIRPSHAGHGFIKSKGPATCKKEKFQAGQCVKGRQEPCHIVQVLEVVATVKQMPTEELAAQIFDNTQRLFFGTAALQAE